MLKIELKRIGPNGRASLIKLWEPQLSNLLQDFEDLSHANTPQQSLPQQQQQIQMQQQQFQNYATNQMNQSSTSLSQSIATIDQAAQQLDQTSRMNTNRIRRKQYVAIILLSLIGAEFGQDINSNQNQTPYKTIPQGFSLEDHSILKRISKLCMFSSTNQKVLI